jgi:hypothetical protein
MTLEGAFTSGNSFFHHGFVVVFGFPMSFSRLYLSVSVKRSDFKDSMQT